MIGAVPEVPGTIINAHDLCSSSALTFWHYTASAYWELVVEDCPPELSGAVDRKWVSDCPRPYCPKFLLWALSLLALYTPESVFSDLWQAENTATATLYFFSVWERIPAGHPFDHKDHTAPSVEWPAFWIQSLLGLCSHPFISNVLEEELLKMSRAHCNF